MTTKTRTKFRPGKRHLFTRIGQPYVPGRDCINATCPGCGAKQALEAAGWRTAFGDRIGTTGFCVMIHMVYGLCRHCPAAVFDYSVPVLMKGTSLPDPEDELPPFPPEMDDKLAKEVAIGFRASIAIAAYRARLDHRPFTDWPDVKSPDEGVRVEMDVGRIYDD